MFSLIFFVLSVMAAFVLGWLCSYFVRAIVASTSSYDQGPDSGEDAPTRKHKRNAA